MINTGSFVYPKLSTDSTLLTLIGSADHIVSSYPEIIETFPLVIFREENQPDVEYADNLPQAVDSIYQVDVYVKNDSPFAITNAVCNIFKGLYWSCVYNSDIPDPDILVRHRVLRFTRPLFASDIA